MRARRIAELLREGVPKADALFAAVAGRMTSPGATAPTPAQMRDRMSARAYVVFVDELDKLSAGDEHRVLGALCDAHAQLEAKKKPIKLIASGHPPAEREQRVVDVMLDPPTNAQREEFFKAYAASRPKRGKGDCDRIRKAAHTFRYVLASTTGAVSPEAFNSPLLLNAFCWGALRPNFDVGACGSLSDLCGLISKLLLERSAGKDGVTLSSEAVETILEEIAFRGLRGDVDAQTARAIAATALGDTADPEKALGVLVRETGLLEQNSADPRRLGYRVISTFADYFAGRKIAACVEDGAALEGVGGVDAERRWRSALAFASALTARGPDAERKQRQLKQRTLLKQLLERTRAVAEPNEQAAWFSCVSAALAALAPNADNDEPPQQAGIDEAADLFAEAHGWTPRQRFQALGEMSAAVRRVTSSQTRRAVNDLCKRMLKLDTHWIKVRDFKHPSGADELLVAGMPVLVAHYHEFHDASRRASDQMGEHDAATPALIGEEGAAKGGAETGADVWAQLNATPSAPMVFVTFFEAVAYCEWLTLTLKRAGQLEDGEVIRLPTEREWKALCAKMGAPGAPYVWGADHPGLAAEARVNWRGAELGAPTPPGTFPTYGAEQLYDFNTNVATWLTPDRGENQFIWPPEIGNEFVDAVGGHFASRHDGVVRFGRVTTQSPDERARERGMRLVRTRCTSGWK